MNLERKMEIKQVLGNLLISILDKASEFIILVQIARLKNEINDVFDYIKVLRVIFISVPASMITAVSINASQSFGAGSQEKFGEYFNGALFTGSALSFIIDPSLFFSSKWLSLFEGSESRGIKSYYCFYVLSVFPGLIINAQQKLFFSSNFCAYPVLMKFLEESLNVMLSICIVQESSSSSLEKITLLGATPAISSNLVFIVNLLSMKFSKSFRDYNYLKRKPSLKELIQQFKEILKYAWCFGLVYGSSSIAFLIQNFMIYPNSLEDRRAQSIITQYYLIFTNVILSIGKAVTICVGNAVGADDSSLIKKREKYSLIFLPSIGLATGLIFVFFPKFLASAFSDDTSEKFEGTVARLFSYAAPLIFLDTVNNTFFGILAGKGLVKKPSIVLATSTCLGLALAAFFDCFLDLGPAGVYLGRILGMGVAMGGLYKMWNDTIDWSLHLRERFSSCCRWSCCKKADNYARFESMDAAPPPQEPGLLSRTWNYVSSHCGFFRSRPSKPRVEIEIREEQPTLAASQ